MNIYKTKTLRTKKLITQLLLSLRNLCSRLSFQFLKEISEGKCHNIIVYTLNKVQKILPSLGSQDLLFKVFQSSSVRI